jgi:hypothetical protein
LIGWGIVDSCKKGLKALCLLVLVCFTEEGEGGVLLGYLSGLKRCISGFIGVVEALEV